MAAVCGSEISWMARALQEASTRVTFWGERVIEFPFYVSPLLTCELDSFVQRFLELSRQHAIADDLSFKERLDGLKCAEKLRYLYVVSDEKVDWAGWPTRLIVWAVDFFQKWLFLDNWIPRWNLEERYPDHWFRSFTLEHFRQHFGEPPAELAGDEYIMVRNQQKPKASVEAIQARAV